MAKAVLKTVKGVVFEWDESTAGENAVKHDGVTFDEAIEVFFDVGMRLVDASLVDAVLKLDVAPGQRMFVSPNARSLAQAAYEPASRALALCDGGMPVGLLLLYDARLDAKKPAEQLYVWRLMIDAGQQKRGLARLAMAWVVDEAQRMGLKQVGLSHVMQPGHAGPFYQKLGFTYTGEIDDGEHKMCLDLPSPA